jgi:hypothetical protein
MPHLVQAHNLQPRKCKYTQTVPLSPNAGQWLHTAVCLCLRLNNNGQRAFSRFLRLYSKQLATKQQAMNCLS